MKRTNINKLLLCVASLFFANIAISQNQVTLPQTYGGETLNINQIDTIKIGTETNKVVISDRIESIQEILFIQDAVDLAKADVTTAGNQLTKVWLSPESNPNIIYSTVEGTKSGSAFSVFVPYLVSFSQLKLSFEATGRVYCNRVQQRSGSTHVDLSSPQEYKVVDAQGNIATYTIRVYNSGLPVLFIKSEEPLSTNWIANNTMDIYYSDDAVNYLGRDVELKYKGSKYSLSSKRSYGVKLDKKAPLLEMSTGKRWSVYSNADDASLVRTEYAFAIAKAFVQNAWIPKTQPVEVVENNQHKGLYLLTEDARLSEERVNAKALLEWTDSYEEDNEYFKSSKYGIIFKLEDSDGMSVEEAKNYIDEFESALAQGNASKKIDMNSFVEWFLLNELFKNKDAKKSSMLSIASDGKISMVFSESQEDAIGNEGESVEGWAIRNSHPWIEKLFEDQTFVAAVNSHLFELDRSARTDALLSSIKQQIALSFEGNAQLYGLNHKLEDEASAITQWIEKRLKWLSEKIAIAYELSKVGQNDQNKILSFEIKKNANSQALLNDYKATIVGDSIKIFVPYLAHFDLKPEFSVSSGAKVYVDDELQTSGSSEVNFVKPVKYKVLSSNGTARVYVVSIYNSGINVLYINTPNNRSINSKETWIDGTKMVAYRCDGTVDFDSSNDNVQVKGRGNSTWSIDGKKPYAVKLNKKSRVFGMAEHKRWALLANYYDVTFFRNEFSNYLSKSFTDADWAPSGVFVELVLNNKHCGNYYFCEQVKIHENRIPGEYLVEADLKEGRGQFQGEKSGNYFNVKDPDVADNSTELQYVKGKINDFEKALYDTTYNGQVNSSSWTKVKQLIDLQSFVDWYIIKELSKDYDGNMYTSCYCHIMKDGLIKMGPIWDFDLAWGGNPFETMFGGGGMFGWGGGGGNDYAWYNQPEGYYVGASQQSAGMGGGWTWNPGGQQQNNGGKGPTNWFMIFFKQKEFRDLVAIRVNTMIEHLDEIKAYIDQNTRYLSLSAESNMACTAYYSDNKNMSYAERMNIIKEFTENRLKWIADDLKRR